MTAERSVENSATDRSGPHDSAMFASLVMSRVAGLPTASCSLTTDATRETLGSIAQVTEELEKLSPDLVDACFALVPRLDDDVPLRRRVLAGKRAAHRLTALPWNDTDRAALGKRGGELFTELTRRWQSLTDRRDGLSASLDKNLRQDGRQALSRLQQTLLEPAFARSLAVVAPDWFRFGRPSASTPSPRDLRTLYSYVTRTALKTSPLSGLTTVGMAGAPGSGRGRSRTSVDVALHILRGLTVSPDTANLLRYRAAPTRSGGAESPNELLLHAELGMGGAKSWRQDRVIEADHAQRWLEGFGSLDREDLELADILRVLGGASPFERFRRLLLSGVLHPVPPWSTDEEPLGVLVRLLEPRPGTAGPFSAAEVAEAEELGASAVESDAPTRVSAALRLRELTDPWMRADWGTAPSTGIIYEDRETDHSLWNPLDNTEIRADLEHLTRRMRPRVFRSHLYDLLVDRFVSEYGRGAHSCDVLGFLMRLSVERDNNPLVDRARGADRTSHADPGDRAWLPVGPTSAPPTAAIFFQVGAHNHQEVENGDYRLVVNQFNSGTGGVFSRFRTLLGGDFTNQLRAHVNSLWNGADVRELVIGTDANTAQAECSGSFPALTLPGEVSGRNDITLDDTVLVHDADTDTLSLVDHSGTPVGLAYLGLVPQHMMASFVRFLTVLADPWINASADADHTLPFDFLEHRGSEVSAIPREEMGRLITNRACWIVPTASLPLTNASDMSERDLVLGMEKFRNQHGIPETVFLHQLGGMNLMMDGAHKPMWADLRSPLSLRTVQGLLREDTRHIRMVEALPEPTTHPERDANDAPRATEHITLAHWTRPEEVAGP